MPASPERPPVCNYEDSDYQASFWEQGGREYEDRAEATALRRLLPATGDLMLELGAGAGRNTQRYAGFKRVVLLDYSRTQLEQAQARLGRSERFIYVAADVYRMPFNAGLFDGATMIRTLHHMVEPQLALRQVRRVLQPAGIFILEYANKQNLKAIARYLLGRQAWNPFQHTYVEFAALNFDFHPVAIREWLEQSGFQVQRQLTVSHFRIDWLKRLVPTGLLVGMDSLASLTGDWWQLSPSVFVRSQAIGQGPAQPKPASESEFFCCLACGHAPLTEGAGGLTCPACGQAWEYRDGIYDFR